MRTIATAIESYSAEHGAYPVVTGTVKGLARFIEPDYIKKAPRTDGWGAPLRVHSNASEYTLVSHGMCSAPDVESLDLYSRGGTTDFRSDPFSCPLRSILPQGAGERPCS